MTAHMLRFSPLSEKAFRGVYALPISDQANFGHYNTPLIILDMITYDRWYIRGTAADKKEYHRIVRQRTNNLPALEGSTTLGVDVGLARYRDHFIPLIIANTIDGTVRRAGNCRFIEVPAFDIVNNYRIARLMDYMFKHSLDHKCRVNPNGLSSSKLAQDILCAESWSDIPWYVRNCLPKKKIEKTRLCMPSDLCGAPITPEGTVHIAIAPHHIENDALAGLLEVALASPRAD